MRLRGAIPKRALWLLASIGIATALASSQLVAGDEYLTGTPAQRIALVVGNATYKNADILPGSVADAREIAKLLTDLGFAVTTAFNVPSRNAFVRDYLVPFAGSIKEGAFVVFYFSGHGFSYAGESYLMPTDSPEKISGDINQTFLAERSVRSYLNDRNPTLVVTFLDACRNLRKFIDSQDPATKSQISKGLAEPLKTPENNIIGYSSKAGFTSAGDAQGKLSVYTSALAEFLPRERMDLDLIAKEVRFKVRHDTNNDQSPWLSESSSAIVFFKKSKEIDAQEHEAWKAALDSGDSLQIGRFLAFHGTSDYGEAARRWLNDHKTVATGYFTQVPPIGPEIAWDIKDPLGNPNSSVTRIFGPLGLERTFRSGSPDTFASHRAQDILINSEAAVSTSQVSADLLVATGRAVALDQVAARGSPDTAAPVLQSYSFGTKLVVEGVETPRAGGTWLKVREDTKGISPTAYIALPTSSSPRRVDLGRPLEEAFIGQKPDAVATLADQETLLGAVEQIRNGGANISWVSIATPRVENHRLQELLAARATHIVDILDGAGLSRGKITVVEGLEGQDIASDKIRVRFFGSELRRDIRQ